MRSRCRCSMCPAIHINSRSWLRSSSTHEPSDPPLRVVKPPPKQRRFRSRRREAQEAGESRGTLTQCNRKDRKVETKSRPGRPVRSNRVGFATGSLSLCEDASPGRRCGCSAHERLSRTHTPPPARLGTLERPTRKIETPGERPEFRGTHPKPRDFRTSTHREEDRRQRALPPVDGSRPAALRPGPGDLQNSSHSV